MEYIFNLSVLFDPENRRLCLLHDENSSVGLSAPAGRLLTVLLQNNGEILTREWLLKTVWEDYGFAGSNSNLNNYLSELRKAIGMLDPKLDIIITIPKVGIKLEANITFTNLKDTVESFPDVKSENEHHVNDPPNATAEKSASVDSKIVSNYFKKSKISYNVFLIVLMLLLTVAIIVIQVTPIKIATKKEPLSFLYELDKCRLYYLNGYSKGHFNISKEEIKKQFSRYKIDCKSAPDKDVYIYEQKDVFNAPEIEFLSFCMKTNNKEDSYSSCLTKNNYREYNAKD